MIGVVGRNGDGKTTLLQVLTGAREPDSGRVTHTSGVSVGYLRQSDDFAAGSHRPRRSSSAAGPTTSGPPSPTRGRSSSTCSPRSTWTRRRPTCQRRRAAPGRAGRACCSPDTTCWCSTSRPTISTSKSIGWLAEHLSRGRASQAMVVVSHDRWFLDAVCTRHWEVHDGAVDAYDGGYAAYVLARAERMRLAAGTEARRKNLLRKELAWLRRGPPARTSKPKFRIDAANDADRRRAAAAGLACAAAVRDDAARQGRVRSAPGAAGGRRPA